MKFAKELEQDAVPEWRVKYLNYKAGKKRIKAVARAITRVGDTPTIGRHGGEHPTYTGFFGRGGGSISSRMTNGSYQEAIDEIEPLQTSPSAVRRAPKKQAVAGSAKEDETSGLAQSPGSAMMYGSFVPPASRASDRYDFALPGPAMKVPSRTEAGPGVSPAVSRQAVQRSVSMHPAVPAGLQTPSTINLPPASASITPRQRLHRIFSTGSALSRLPSNKLDIGMQHLDQVRANERDFFSFLDSELDKIESFYKQKEDQASERLVILREQLHEMRNRRTEEIAESKKKREQESNRRPSDDDAGEGSKDNGRDWMTPIKSRMMKPGPNSKALQRMNRTPVMTGQTVDERRDYVRRPPSNDVPYRTAKRKLKLALQEFYRGLELLKSYALLNRTAFRKLNKKYDKAVNARPPYRYMTEKVNKSWFVNSDILDGHIRTVEDLYARYFERGNHKIAAGKLRNLNRRAGDASDCAFRSGLLIGTGAVFGVQGLIYGAELLFDQNEELADQTAYLLQLYGGYFLILFLFALFTLDCRMWTRNKINYPFIFEFDTRNNLDWKELAEFPSFFFALFGIFIWLNFSRFGAWEDMYLYYPVILICLSLAILFFPAPIIHHRARKWLLYSHYRLFFAGFYPVEFRDFFLGDIWCSLTYATCNIELFFCLYATEWDDPVQCNSNHSRLMGFFGALPPIWRALQCIRRYYDTRNVFPHLVNCGKYTMSILAAVLLSVYRMDGTQTNLSFFITFATINAVYCSIWDLFMDFSLLQAHARRPLLRDITALKKTWIYYLIMILDPILRFSWIFYAIFTHNTQHSTVVSFFVSFSEVTRRGMWTLLRVENEHCANVAQYKASRDIPLPYHIDTPEQQSEEDTPRDTDITQASPMSAAMSSGTAAAGRPSQSIRTATATGTPATFREGQQPEEGGSSGLRRRSSTVRRRYTNTDTGKRSILQAMAEAHKQDFQKKKPPTEEETKAQDLCDDEEEEDRSEEEDDDDSRSMHNERLHVREADALMEDEDD